jgi:tetratricopeptide (TPR) repeat protein
VRKKIQFHALVSNKSMTYNDCIFHDDRDFMIRINQQLLILLLFAVSAVSAISFSGAAYAAQRNEADEYKACIKLTKREPEIAFESALSWRDQGGGSPARHCAALALIGIKQYHLAAPRLEKLAEEMRSSGSELVLPTLRQAANSWLLAKNYPRAHAVASAALEIEPDNEGVLIDRARILAAAENYQEAFDDLDLALRLNPTRPDALTFRAAARRHLGQMDRALEDADLAVSLSPKFVDALIERGILLRLAGRDDEARADWLKVLQLSPNSSAGETARKNIEKMDVRN